MPDAAASVPTDRPSRLRVEHLDLAFGIDVAGIQLLADHPGYRHFRVAPLPGRGIEWARAIPDTPYGRIESAWELSDGGLSLTVEVPPGTTAELVLPDGSPRTVAPGRHTVSLVAS